MKWFFQEKKTHQLQSKAIKILGKKTGKTTFSFRIQMKTHKITAFNKINSMQFIKLTDRGSVMCGGENDEIALKCMHMRVCSFIHCIFITNFSIHLNITYYENKKEKDKVNV